LSFERTLKIRPNYFRKKSPTTMLAGDFHDKHHRGVS
jgi:hypothetical protein